MHRRIKKELREEREKKSKNDHEMSTLQRQIQTLAVIEETLKLKETEWEFKDKEIDKLLRKVIELEKSLSTKRVLIDNLEQKLF